MNPALACSAMIQVNVIIYNNLKINIKLWRSLNGEKYKINIIEGNEHSKLRIKNLRFMRYSVAGKNMATAATIVINLKRKLQFCIKSASS